MGVDNNLINDDNNDNDNDLDLDGTQEHDEELSLKDLSKEDRKSYYKKELLSWFYNIAFCYIVVSLINTFILQIVIVNGTSMQPTLSEGDKLITNKIFQKYERGDIVVIENEHPENLVKRIIATEGETIRIDFQTGDVFINEQLLSEVYIRGNTTSSYGFSGEAVVPEGHVFVMGDNRNASNDSRNPDIGFVDVDNIFGTTFFRLYPFDTFGTLG